MTSRELFRFLRALKGLNVIGGEVTFKYLIQIFLLEGSTLCLLNIFFSPALEIELKMIFMRPLWGQIWFEGDALL